MVKLMLRKTRAVFLSLAVIITIITIMALKSNHLKGPAVSVGLRKYKDLPYNMFGWLQETLRITPCRWNTAEWKEDTSLVSLDSQLVFRFDPDERLKRCRGPGSGARRGEVLFWWSHRELEEDLADSGASAAPPSDPFSTTGGQLVIKMVLQPPRLSDENFVLCANLWSKHSLPECPAKINIWIFFGTPKPA